MQAWLDAEHGPRVCVPTEIRQVPPVFPSPAVSVLPSRMTTSVATPGRLDMDTPSYVGVDGRLPGKAARNRPGCRPECGHELLGDVADSGRLCDRNKRPILCEDWLVDPSFVVARTAPHRTAARTAPPRLASPRPASPRLVSLYSPEAP